MQQYELRQKLIEGTIKTIAREGLDKASTKQIALAAAVNEVYIYRCFSDKEDMINMTFSYLDDELTVRVLYHVPVMYMQELEYETRCRLFIQEIWKCLLGNKDKCLAYIRYYYSPYFAKYSVTTHKQRYIPLLKKFEDAFKDEANIWMILNHILNTMLDFAVKVHNDEIKNDDDTAEHVFRVIYHSVKQYFKNTEKNMLKTNDIE